MKRRVCHVFVSLVLVVCTFPSVLRGAVWTCDIPSSTVAVDTLYYDEIEPAVIVAKRKGREWRKYYRLVYNFAKVYPYALVAKEILFEADSTITAEQMRKRDQKKYINHLQDRLFDTFEDAIRDMTVSQGKLLLRLIDRETGITPYEIIKNYKSKIAAGFWQGVAKLFGSDMKAPYDPEGEDKMTEELVVAYQKGDFFNIYRSIYGKDPVPPVAKPKNDFPQKARK